MALTDEEIKLIGRLTVDASETSARFVRQAKMITIGAVVVAAISALREIWFLVPITLVFGGGIALIVRAAARKSSPERAAPVLHALREAPDRVVRIEHVETSDSRRIFVRHWVVVKTDHGVLRVLAEDWQPLIAALARRCPGATIA
jgi:hypothetical protein